MDEKTPVAKDRCLISLLQRRAVIVSLLQNIRQTVPLSLKRGVSSLFRQTLKGLSYTGCFCHHELKLVATAKPVNR